MLDEIKSETAPAKPTDTCLQGDVDHAVDNDSAVCNKLVVASPANDLISVNDATTENKQVFSDDKSNEPNSMTLATLNYVNVSVQGLDNPVKSLVDGGSQLNVIRADVCESLNLTPVGEVSIRGVFGSPVKTQIVKLHVKLHDVDCDKLQPHYTAILCAVCPDLNEAFILTLPTADELYTAYSTASVVDCNSLPVLSSCAVTRSQARNAIEQTDYPLDNADSQDASVASGNDVANDKQDSVSSFVYVDDINLRSSAADSKFSQEQISDSSLAFAFRLAQKQKSGYLIKDGLLFRKEKLYGQDYVNLVVPKHIDYLFCV